METFQKYDNGRLLLQRLKQPARHDATVIWFPFGGGLAHSGKPLCDALPDNWLCFGLEGPGRLRTKGPTIPDIVDLADYYCDTLPCELLSGAILIGHSVGALIAGHVAQCLERRGAPAKALIMGAARPPHSIPTGRLLSNLTEDGLFQWWRSINGANIPDGQQRDVFDLYKEIIRTDIEVYESARESNFEWHETPAHLTLGRQDPVCPLEIEKEWGRVPTPPKRDFVDGGHLFVVEKPDIYAQSIAQFVAAIGTNGVQVDTVAQPKHFPNQHTPQMTSIRLSTDAEPVIVPVIDDREAAKSASNVNDRLKTQRDHALDCISQNGAVLIRGFDINTAAAFRDALIAIGVSPIAYRAGNSPRTNLGDHIYTSSEYSKNLDISPHCELSYLRRWPKFIAFCCLENASTGGETILVRMDKVAASLDAQVVSKFAEHGVIYERRLPLEKGFGRTWPETFECDDPGRVEVILLEQSVSFKWSDGHKQLSMQHRGPGMLKGETNRSQVWFNQADQWHPSALPQDVRAYFEEPDNPSFPHNCWYGDGSLIEEDHLAHIRDGLDRNSANLRLDPGDILLLDNTLVAHGRRAFQGKRRILTAVADLTNGD